jgi:RNA polymerase sigma-70 factor (sigma-E family)
MPTAQGGQPTVAPVPAEEAPSGSTVGGQRPRDAEFSAFMAASAGALLRTAWFLVGDPHRAEELAQEALARTYAAWPRARRDPLAYARRVLVNLRTDAWRRRRREVLTDPTSFPERSATPPPADGRDALVRALQVLSARQRRVVVLRYVLDMSEADVAAEMGISPGTVRSTASRALARLRVEPALRGAGGTDGRA